ncbi:hypothetical protein EVAR_17378_1 [Eumeta japonica]|uniref:Uncharacterized protein n=1 Tax=Eumeta variegata TaxID=151549 RepID=A0A4C1WIY9_EUMVA|nr:hypothetical protein EVAR_17378_1 [Eumeta japonica]
MNLVINKESGITFDLKHIVLGFLYLTHKVSGSLTRCPERSQHSPGFASRPNDTLKFIFPLEMRGPTLRTRRQTGRAARPRGAAPTRVSGTDKSLPPKFL